VEPALYVILTAEPLRRPIPAYELGITTPDSIEEGIGKEWPRNADHVKLATLPFLALAQYWDRIEGLDKHREQEIDAALAAFEWTKPERPERLEHKYFTVYHWPI
jgi:hypothetical protein